MRNLGLFALLWLSLCAIHEASAQTTDPGGPTPASEASLAIKADEQLADAGGTSVGDIVDLFTGSLSFQQTDVSLPGNSVLPVDVTRHFDAGIRSALPTTSNLPFGTWDFNIPRITAVLASNAPWPTNRCSSAWNPPIVQADTKTSYSGSQYSQGIQLKLPLSSALMLRYDSSSGYPAPSGTTFIAADNILFTCTTATDMSGASSGEGFVALLPNGTRYVLNRHSTQTAAALAATSSECGDKICRTPGLNRYTAVMYASQAIDRFGNTVNYTYNTSGQLTQIQASDGRTLTIAWTNGYVSSVSDGSRTWTYQYNGSELTGVTRPDGTRWQYSINGLFTARAGDPNGFPSVKAKGFPATGTMISPYGLTASFTINNITQPVGNSPGTAVPLTYWTPGITSKQLSGPGMSTQSWSYQYSQTSGWYASNGGSSTKTISVTDPAGTVTTSAYDIRFGWQEGLLVSTATSGSDGTASTESNTYQQTATIGLSSTSRNSYRDAHANRLTSKATVINGDTYTIAYNSPDGFKNPTQLVESNNFSSNSKTDARTYFNSATTSLWVIGQQSSSTFGGVQVAQTTFNSLGMPQDRYSFGLRTSTSNYASDGTLYTYADGLNRVTKLENYYRGKSQKITLPDSTVFNRAVTPTGVFSSVTDGRGNTTTLGYDSINRLTGVTYPTGDTVSWTSRSISYSTTTATELGLPAGVFRARSTLGRQRKTTYYDPTLHPLLVEQYDTTTGEARYVNTQYDFRGNLTYQSYPSSSSGSTAGVYTRYDGLGRAKQTQLSDNTVVKSIAYLSGNRQSVTDATSHTTTTTYQAFGEPAYDAPLVIAAPESQTTTYTRNVFGEVLSANRSGGGASLTETNVYDSYHRLCKVIRPESGQHVIGLDAASQIIWSASGVGGSTTDCDYASVPASERTQYSYDPRGRKTLIDYADASGDVTLGYDADSHLTSVTNPTATWNYTWNKRGILQSEQLLIDSTTYNIAYSYDTLGNLSSRLFPDNLGIAYSPNAWGQPTRMDASCCGDSPLSTFASNIQYFPNGVTKSYSLGSGASYQAALDARQRLQSQVVSNPSALQSLSYTYNDDNQITQLTDNLDGSDSASYGYDGLHRVTTANGLWGNYTYGYDAIGNLQARSGTNTLTYTYDGTNRLTSVSGGASRSYGYDGRGRVTSDGRFGYTWNQADQITNAPGAASYGYDGNGKRVKSVKADGTVEYTLYDFAGTMAYVDTPQSGLHWAYLPIDGRTAVKVVNGGPTYLFSDNLGSPRLATNNAGNVLWREHYEPYGKKMNGVAEKVGYTGHAYDPETSLTYMQARYYDAEVGRFMTTDPIGSKDDLNLYGYVHGDPIDNADPTGTQTGSNIAKDAPGVVGHGFVKQIANASSSNIGGNASPSGGSGNVPNWAQTSGACLGSCHNTSPDGSIRSMTPKESLILDGVSIGVSLLVPGAGEAAAFGTAGKSTTTLYRAVGTAEFDSLMATKTFQAGPNSLGGKFFAESAEHAGQWGNAMEGAGNFRLIEARFATSQANNFMRWEKLDGIGPARYAELDQLKDALIRAVK